MLKFLNNEYSESRRNIRRFVMSNPEKKKMKKNYLSLNETIIILQVKEKSN
jgi:hypothetical protein